MTPPETFAGRQVGSVRLEFEENRITRLTSEHHGRVARGRVADAVGRA